MTTELESKTNTPEKVRKPIAKLKHLNQTNITTIGGSAPIIVNGQLTD